jgi:hypothetical protein
MIARGITESSIVEKFSYFKRKAHPVHPQRENVAQEVLARASNFMVARSAFDTSVSLWPVAQIELRQGARVNEVLGNCGGSE